MPSPPPGSYYPGRYWWLPGSVGILFIVGLAGLPMVALLQYLKVPQLLEPFTDPWLRRVIYFSLYQGLFSTVLSIGLAIPVARALSRRQRFWGRAVLLKVFSIALIIPTIVAVFGIVAVYGKTGWLNTLLENHAIETGFSIYGLTGILIAHVFFNLPMATRVILQALDSIPQNNWKISAQLGMSSWNRFLLLEWVAIRQQLPGLCLLVFSLCFTSFAIVMTLGGGPAATTIEVAIYQALRFDFDIGTAVVLSLIQLAVCVLLMLITLKYNTTGLLVANSGSVKERFERDSIGLKLADFLTISVAFLFVMLPLIAIFAFAWNPALSQVVRSPSTLTALWNTLWVACASGLLSMLLGCLLISTVRHLVVRRNQPVAGRMLELPGLTILVMPPVVLGTGLFLLLRPYADVFSVALVLVILVNALMGLPFVIRIVSVPAAQCALQHDRLCASLGMTGWRRLRLIEWPILRKSLGLAAAIATTLSAGDLTVIALFGSERVATLPLLLYQRMGSYRLYEAAATALVLLLLCLVLFWVVERLVGGRDVSH